MGHLKSTLSPSICLSTCLCAWFPIFLTLYLFVYLPDHVSGFLSFSLSIYLSVYLLMCLVSIFLTFTSVQCFLFFQHSSSQINWIFGRQVSIEYIWRGFFSFIAWLLSVPNCQPYVFLSKLNIGTYILHIMYIWKCAFLS